MTALASPSPAPLAARMLAIVRRDRAALAQAAMAEGQRHAEKLTGKAGAIADPVRRRDALRRAEDVAHGWAEIAFWLETGETPADLAGALALAEAAASSFTARWIAEDIAREPRLAQSDWFARWGGTGHHPRAPEWFGLCTIDRMLRDRFGKAPQ